MDDRRRLLFHGFLILTLAFALGLVAAPLGDAGHPHARLWMGAHVSGILIGLFLLLLGLVRPHLALGARAGRVFYAAAVGGNWVGMLTLGIFNAAIGGGTSIVHTSLPKPAGWQAGLIGVAIFVVTVTTLTTCVLGVWGARRAPNQ